MLTIFPKLPLGLTTAERKAEITRRIEILEQMGYRGRPKKDSKNALRR
jgi:hypothetical protein